MMCTFDSINTKEKIKLRETNDVYMRKKEKHNIERKKYVEEKKHRQQKCSDIKTIDWCVHRNKRC